MKVWLLTYHEYDESIIDGLFFNEEDAWAAAAHAERVSVGVRWGGTYEVEGHTPTSLRQWREKWDSDLDLS